MFKPGAQIDPVVRLRPNQRQSFLSGLTPDKRNLYVNEALAAFFEWDGFVALTSKDYVFDPQDGNPWIDLVRLNAKLPKKEGNTGSTLAPLTVTLNQSNLARLNQAIDALVRSDCFSSEKGLKTGIIRAAINTAMLMQSE